VGRTGEGDEPGDFERAKALIERDRFEIEVGKGKGILVEIAGVRRSSRSGSASTALEVRPAV
jgi:hypothetical protein